MSAPHDRVAAAESRRFVELATNKFRKSTWRLTPAAPPRTIALGEGLGTALLVEENAGASAELARREEEQLEKVGALFPEE